MSTQTLNPSERLRLGIEAARTGRENEARTHLIAVLKQDPNNIPAMLWLAFVLPSAQDTIRLLQRVLTLDPNNERAKAGIRWARVRLGLPPEEAPPRGGDPPSASSPSSPPAAEEHGEDSIRSILLSEEVQQKAKKGAMAHRARRTINPFFGLVLILGAVGLMAVGLGALMFVPAETLAAWLPVTAPPKPVGSRRPVVPPRVPEQVMAAAPKPMAKSFSSAADTLVRPPASMYQKDVPSTPSAAKPAASVEAVKPVTVNPAQLIGPMGPMATSGKPAVSVGQVQLVHQPASPTEKWIEVNVTTQQLLAWEGDKLVMSFRVSTGLPGTPTVLGEFNIYEKLEATLMVGPNYYLPDVPYTMYFYRGYALHGTYWHENFGQPMSHGCVNLKTEQAKQLFEWAAPLVPPGQIYVDATTDNPGTLVVVHE